MRILFCLSVLFFCVSGVKAQEENLLYLWPNEVPGETAPKKEHLEKRDSLAHIVRITEVTNPTLKIYKPLSAKKNGKAIIICPGGGYHILAADLEGYEVAEWLTALGYTAFVLHYRVPQKREGALYDVQRAIRIVRHKALEWDLDPSAIGVMGFSAGGSLSARASTQFNIDRYPKVDAADKVSSRPNFSLLIYPAYLDQGENRALTPELTITENTPPMFLFATADDPHANSALVMAMALRDAKIPVGLHILPEGGHGYGLRKGKTAAETWPLLAETWLTSLFNE
ncbi:alpha/beta hydrolase [Arenibacter sp. GZD96]|uniref:alpha/beta hydrolase n=1 Tax=Aurantibrevibacter litoralis TaxID=3106030 RepID=UPI002AFF5EDA|nr:alpha/beta hydrolase [Arenibacter sp. GZD-96]MEA1785002.1 alpha/beta hydrolase [Arenibacter sp. GZD-96]